LVRAASPTTPRHQSNARSTCEGPAVIRMAAAQPPIGCNKAWQGRCRHHASPPFRQRARCCDGTYPPAIRRCWRGPLKSELTSRACAHRSMGVDSMYALRPRWNFPPGGSLQHTIRGPGIRCLREAAFNRRGPRFLRIELMARGSRPGTIGFLQRRGRDGPSHSSARLIYRRAIRGKVPSGTSNAVGQDRRSPENQV